MNIPYDYYKTFYYVAMYHSFTKAAEIMLQVMAEAGIPGKKD